MKALRIVGLVLGACMVLLGCIWVLQGLNILPGLHDRPDHLGDLWRAAGAGRRDADLVDQSSSSLINPCDGPFRGATAVLKGGATA